MKAVFAKQVTSPAESHNEPLSGFQVAAVFMVESAEPTQVVCQIAGVPNLQDFVSEDA
jgi:hypothetical protein